jgi:signal transduction histidine kinase
VKVVTAVASVSTAVAMPFMVPKVHTVIRDAKQSRAREVAAARADALAEQNARLEALAADLEQANAELRRTAAAADEARRTAEEARRVADAANRVKSEFLAVMSHELRTPLNAIGGYTELIELGLRGPVTPEQTEDLRRIRRSQAHLLGLITDVLNFSRLEGARVTYAPRAVPLAAALDQASEMIAPQAAQRSTRLPAGAVRRRRGRVGRPREGCGRSCSTCCRTRSSTRRPAVACGSPAGPTPGARTCAWRTRGSGSRGTSTRRCSSRSCSSTAA